jgi:hypothetical protein
MTGNVGNLIQELTALASYWVGAVDDSIDLVVEELGEVLRLYFGSAEGAEMSAG